MLGVMPTESSMALSFVSFTMRLTIAASFSALSFRENITVPVVLEKVRPQALHSILARFFFALP